MLYLFHHAAYGGSFGYKIGTALVKEPLLTLLGPIRSNFAVIFQAASGIDIDTGTEILWTGDPADRTDTGNVGFLLVLLFAQGTANTILESVCDVSPDDIEVPLVCVDLPNPLKVICEATELVLKFTGQILSDLEAQAAFQDSLVDGAVSLNCRICLYFFINLCLQMELSFFEIFRCTGSRGGLRDWQKYLAKELCHLRCCRMPLPG